MSTILLPFLAANVIGISAGALGCFVVWRRLSYFTDSLAHSSLLGIALSMIFDFNLTLSVLCTAILVALLLHILQRYVPVARDALVGLLSHSFVALGIMLLALVHLYGGSESPDPHAGHDHAQHEEHHEEHDDHESHEPIDPHAGHNHGYEPDTDDDLLFGNIMNVSNFDVLTICVFGLVCLLLLFVLWRPLFASGVSSEITDVELDWRARYAPAVFIVLIALIVSIAIEVMGALLIASLLIIPPISARVFSGTPERMGILSVCFAIVSINLGIVLSLQLGTPTGATIIVFTFLFACLSFIVSSFRRVAKRPL